MEALLAHRHAGGLAIYACIVLLTAGGLTAAALVPVTQTINAVATLGPVFDRQTLRAASDGRVERVFARLGSAVAAGDTLLVLGEGERGQLSRANRKALNEEHALIADLARLAAARADSAEWYAPVSGTARARAWAATASLDWRQSSIEVARAEQLERRMSGLAARGFAERAEVDDAELALARARQLRMLALEHSRAEWRSQLSTARERAMSLQRELAAGADDAASRVVTAPVSGTIEEMASVAPGGVIRAGDPVATLSPNGELRAVALVAPRDAVHLRVGMAARLLVEGYDVQEWGSAAAEVESVGGDFTVVDGRPVFRVSIRAHASALRRPDGRTVPLRKGLRCQVRIQLAQRRLGQIALRRAQEWMDPAAPAGP